MSILDILIYTADWLFQNAIIPLLPNASGDFSITEMQTALDSFKNLLISSFSGLGFMAPMSLVLLLVVLILVSEFTLFVFNITMRGLKWAHIIG